MMVEDAVEETVIKIITRVVFGEGGYRDLGVNSQGSKQ